MTPQLWGCLHFQTEATTSSQPQSGSDCAIVDFEITVIVTRGDAVDLFDWQPRFPGCVMFGHEVDGLRPELLAMADAHVRIPMLGQKKSLNVATAGGVVLYELLRKWRGMGER